MLILTHKNQVNYQQVNQLNKIIFPLQCCCCCCCYYEHPLSKRICYTNTVILLLKTHCSLNAMDQQGN